MMLYRGFEQLRLDYIHIGLHDAAVLVSASSWLTELIDRRLVLSV